jgi:hypothetical protein
MDAVDKAVPKKRGPKKMDRILEAKEVGDAIVDQKLQAADEKRLKEDPATPLGEYIAKEASKNREAKKQAKIVEKWYELHGAKLLLCKRSTSGTVHRTFIGSTEDKKTGADVKEFVKKLKAENRLRIRV